MGSSRKRRGDNSGGERKPHWLGAHKSRAGGHQGVQEQQRIEEDHSMSWKPNSSSGGRSRGEVGQDGSSRKGDRSRYEAEG